MATFPNLIKNNADELQSYLLDLKHWEKDIKKQDFKLKNKANFNEEGLNSEMEENQEVQSKLKMSQATLTNVVKAEKLKEEGNAYYTKGKLEDAVVKYTRGISLDPSNKLLHANRAMAYIKLKKYKAAESDCNRCLQLDSTYIKAYLRRASARANLGNLSTAIEDYEKVLQLEQWNSDAKRELEKLKCSLKSNLLTKSSTTAEGCKVVTQLHSKNHFQNLNSEDITELQELKNEKIKIEEVESSNGENIPVQSKACLIEPIEKPFNLQSKKSLVTLHITDVSNKEELHTLLDKNIYEISKEKNVENIKTNTKRNVTNNCINKPSILPSLPNPPKTSHQFSQDWAKVLPYPDLAESYLKSISVKFYNKIEVNADQIVEIVDLLNGDTIEADVGAAVMLSLMESRGFFINLAFLEGNQKEVLRKFLLKIKISDMSMEEMTKLEAAL